MDKLIEKLTQAREECRGQGMLSMMVVLKEAIAALQAAQKRENAMFESDDRRAAATYAESSQGDIKLDRGTLYIEMLIHAAYANGRSRGRAFERDSLRAEVEGLRKDAAEWKQHTKNMLAVHDGKADKPGPYIMSLRYALSEKRNG